MVLRLMTGCYWEKLCWPNAYVYEKFAFASFLI